MSFEDNPLSTPVSEPVVTVAERHSNTLAPASTSNGYNVAEPITKPGDSSVMRVFPPVVEFHGVEVGTLYVITITIQNTSNSVRRVRFQPPKSKAFTLRNEPKGGLAPGLDVTADIEFFAESEQDFHDKLTVVSGKYNVEIPLHAFAPAPRIEFDGFVDFGVCVLENATSKIVEFKNVGMAIGEFEIEYDEDLPIKIEPRRGTLHPLNPPLKIDLAGKVSDDEDDNSLDSEASSAFERKRSKNMEGKPKLELEENFPKKTSARIRIEYTGKELGAFRALAKVAMVGQPDRVLDINAQLVQQSLELVLPEGGGQVSSLNFGTLYFSHARTINTLLVNNGPFPASFTVHLNEEVHVSDDEVDYDNTNYMMEKEEQATPPYTSSPSDGIIQPYSQLPVILQFLPFRKKQKTGWAQTIPDPNDMMQAFNVEGNVECVDTHQSIAVHLSGKAVVAHVRIDASVFDFGE